MSKYVWLLCAASALVWFDPVDSSKISGQDKKPAVKKEEQHATGYKMPSKEVSQARRNISNIIHRRQLMALPKADEAAWDNVALGFINDMQDQNGCGDCYMWSGVDVCANAYRKAGVKIPGNGQLSVQALLDWHPNFGGCNGGDEWEVTAFILQAGVPSLADYPGKGTSPGQRRDMTGMKQWKIASMGYCDPNAAANGVASTQSMKDCVKAYGSISVAVCANGWGDPGNSVMSGPNTGINHAVQIVGWDDSKMAWKMRNQWGTGWGNGGYAWVKYGSYGIGTEAYFVTITAPPPPPPPVPESPPYKLFEGTMAAPVAVGDKAGYSDLVSAEKAAKVIAEMDKASVMIHDSKDNMIETVNPTPPAPKTVTITIPGQTIPAQTFSFRTGFTTHTVTLPAMRLPDQTVTGTINP